MNLQSYILAGMIALGVSTGCTKSPPSINDLRKNILSSVNDSLQSDKYQLQDGDQCDILVAEDRIGIFCKGNSTISPIISVPNSGKVTGNIGVQNVLVSNHILDINSGKVYEYTESSGQKI